jgi:deazaflavin-dependent oxidoreductase (nitroreductase family)
MTDHHDFNEEMVEQFRANGGRMDMGPVSIVLLTTTGAKTGQSRVKPLAAFEDGGRLYVIASYAGAPHHPAWYHNLVANPSVTVEHDGEKYEAVANVVADTERDPLYATLVDRVGQFGEYQEKTERKIPMVELVRVRAG